MYDVFQFVMFAVKAIISQGEPTGHQSEALQLIGLKDKSIHGCSYRKCALEDY